MKLARWLGANNEVCLRWQSIAAFLIYMLYTYRILLRTNKDIIVWSGFASLSHHKFLGSNFLIERFALFIVPVFIFTMLFFLEAVIAISKPAKVIAVSLLLLTVGALFHFAVCMNTTYCLNWKYDADTKQMISDLEKDHSGSNVNLGISWFYEPAINFYRNTKKLTLVK